MKLTLKVFFTSKSPCCQTHGTHIPNYKMFSYTISHTVFFLKVCNVTHYGITVFKLNFKRYLNHFLCIYIIIIILYHKCFNNVKTLQKFTPQKDKLQCNSQHNTTFRSQRSTNRSIDSSFVVESHIPRRTTVCTHCVGSGQRKFVLDCPENFQKACGHFVIPLDRQ